MIALSVCVVMFQSKAGNAAVSQCRSPESSASFVQTKPAQPTR